MRPKLFTLLSVKTTPTAGSLLRYADALGASRRMLAYCRSGDWPVPRTVALACLGWEDVVKNDGRVALPA